MPGAPEITPAWRLSPRFERLHAAHRPPSGDPPAILVETMQVRFAWRHEDVLAELQRRLALEAQSERSDAVGLRMHERVGAEVLGEAHLCRPFARAGRYVRMLGPDSDRRRAALRRGRPLDHVHGRRADEAGDKETVRPVVEVERRADLRDRASIENDDLVG